MDIQCDHVVQHQLLFKLAGVTPLRASIVRKPPKASVRLPVF